MAFTNLHPTKGSVKIVVGRLSLEGIVILKLFFSDEIAIDEIFIKDLDVSYTKDSNATPQEMEANAEHQRFKSIKVEKLNIENGTIRSIDRETETEKFFVQKLGLRLYLLYAQVPKRVHYKFEL